MPPSAALSRHIAAYYAALEEYQHHRAHNEGATRHAFQTLLTEWGRPRKLTLLAEQSITGSKNRRIQVDGLIVDQFGLKHGFWEAKDTADDLDAEITQKIAAGYPLTNTIFENTRRAVLYQNGSVAFDADITQPSQLQTLLERFFSYTEPHIEEFHKAVIEFHQRIPELAQGLTNIINEAKDNNLQFRAALGAFLQLCRDSLNPATTQDEVEDMLKQHILTERIFRSIFDNPDFVHRNVVAVELEKMVAALTITSFSRNAFLSRLDFFFKAIESEARTITDYKEKQSLLNTLYEQFFQAYSTRAADTHGIVYTPHEIVEWMVNSVEQALKAEFDLSLASPGVHIIDPCVGTGTFIMELLRHIPSSALPHKYAEELHANEVLLLPYYIAAQNIEHAYYERTGQYAPFEGLCFADTLNMETLQRSMFAAENTERIVRQNEAPIRVVMGNPPYNVGQKNENDNNKNRRNPRVDARIKETYIAASKATLRTQVYDPYVKFFRWATDRLDERDGIVCFVSNNSFLDQIAFDGMRKHLLQDFTRIYTLDLGGNVRKNPKLSGTTHNVFGIQVGVTITLLIRNSEHVTRELFYARVGEFWKKEQKLQHLAKVGNYDSVQWELQTPDARNTWLTEGLHAAFDSFIPMSTKEAKGARGLEAESIFKTYSPGVFTGRDPWVYDFQDEQLAKDIQLFIETYNEQVFRWTRRQNSETDVDGFVTYDDHRMKWSRNLKRDLKRSQFITFSRSAIRRSLYRPFTKQFLYFADQLVDERGTLGTFFPTREAELENTGICVSGMGHRAPFTALLTSVIPNYSINSTDGFRCFPFYTYAEDGTNRRENITDWALSHFRDHYADPTITKRNIFHYVYAVLHSPTYRATYAENLKRDLPRIPFVPAPSFRPYVQAGDTLATLHRDYEQAQPYPLQRLENPDIPFTWTVQKMRLTPDRASITYNPSLTLSGIPPQIYNYRLGNRSALEWVLDQYRVTEDPRSALRSDPNNQADPEAIVRLIEQIVTVSLETVKVVDSLPPLTAP